MNIKKFTCAMLFGISMMMNAENTVTTIKQVTDGVTVSEDVDYVIESEDPFATSGSVNITNTEHAVVIFGCIKPSKVISTYLKDKVFVNGVQAENGKNCQVKMYGAGAIVLPYDKDMKPLTVYAEQNYEGESCNDFGLENTGGFMNTLPDTKLNNKIRSFKLKRGYMVTFAIGTGGWGYSRCFIADKEDLEIATLPAILDKRISSYRVFHWYNAQKKGLASDGRKEANSTLNTSWCYDWAQGNASLLPDTEWVPNHIYEDWPSPATCGGVTGSCHMKTNNEPGNSADDHPQTVEEVLNNWQNLMRTGMRLCSESSHDGSWNHLRAFIDSIDARGWRCDLVDLHCYWSGGFDNMKTYYDRYGGRPIWISEWVWGASWNNNGIFATDRSYSKANQQKNYDNTKPILESLNSQKWVERYAYWNSEADCSKIYKDGKTSILGTYYASMNSGLGYDPSIQKIPNATRLETPKAPTATYTKATATAPASIKISWTCPNGDLMETINVQCKLPGQSSYTTIGTVEPKDKSSNAGVNYSFTYTPEESGTYSFRIKEVAYNNKNLTTEGVVVNVAPAQGDSKVQYGKLTIDSPKAIETAFSESMDEVPAVFIGTITNSNGSYKFGNNEGATNTKAKFTYEMLPWKSNTASMTKSEEMPFLAMVPGNYKFGNLDCEVGVSKSAKASSNTWTDEAEVVFNQPFPEGVTPIILTEIRKPNYTNDTALGVRVYEVTNTGFKYIIYSEDKAQKKVSLTQNVCYLAITPGFDYISEEGGVMIAAGHGAEEMYGTSQRPVDFTIDTYDESGDSIKANKLMLHSPIVLTNLQTNNYPTLCTLRRTDVTERIDDIAWTTGTKVKRTLDHSITVDGKEIPSSSTANSYAAYRDRIGWVAVANFKDGGSSPKNIAGDADAISILKSNQKLNVSIANRTISVSGAGRYDIFNSAGSKVANGTVLPPGIYLIKAGNRTEKVIVK